ncbi:hypothetical protein [Streptomyces scopuliridis]|uniref:hypothetical protein n=1 Tax=Streptomyces scopuliridis TaxID=452529 RepID=UPI0034230256
MDNEDWSVDYRDDVRDQLRALGWKENDEGFMVKDGALWTEINEHLESGLDAPDKSWNIEFPCVTPAAVIVAACEAAVAV